MINVLKMEAIAIGFIGDETKLTDNERVEMMVYRSAFRGGRHVTLSVSSVSVSMYDYLYDLGYKITHKVRDTGSFYKIEW